MEQNILEYLVHHVDYISLHNYVGNGKNNFSEFMASTLFAEEAIHITEGIIREEMSKAGRKDPIYIAFDEYNVWYRARGEEGNEEKYNLEDALVVAGYLNAFVRNAHIVKMANLAQLVNVIAPIFTTKEGLFYQTIFFPLQLFSNYCQGVSIQPFVDCDSYVVNHKNVPYLDVSSAYNESKNELVLNVVNRSVDQSIVTDIISQYGKFNGKALIYEVNGKDIKEGNSMEKQSVKTKMSEQNVKGEKFTYPFPAHSLTVIRIPVSKN